MQYSLWGPSFRLYTLFGIAVRLHWTFPGLFLIVLLHTWPIGEPLLGLALGGAIALIILLHEYGHAVMANKLGAGSHDIILSFFGGAALCGEGRNAWEDVLIAFAGPMVNLVLIGALLTPIALDETSAIDASLFNPFAAWGASFWVWLFKANLILTAFNLLLPLYPLDGGRIVTGVIAARTGRSRALMFTTVLAFALATILIGVGVYTGNILLILICLLLLWDAARIRRLAKWGMIPEYSETFDAGYGVERETWKAADDKPEPGPGFIERWRVRREEKKRRREDRQREELKRLVDAILDKVSREGMGSLTAQERRTLQEASRRMRED
jgi:Zn-dependent protease